MEAVARVKHTDFLVIGGGVAGLRAAIEIAESGGRVLVVTKDRPSESSTEYAQGGVAVALSDEDEVSIHYRDTLRAGDGLCRAASVRTLVEQGPEEIGRLIDWGAQFDREGIRLAFGREAAHSRSRILRARGDSTGREIMRTLVRKIRSYPNVSRLSHSCSLDLIASEGVCRGVLVVQGEDLTACYARAVLLATGGGGQLYSRTTNPMVATGDGMAMAYRAGALMEDMEMVQFHPTSLYVPGAPQFLLSEAIRGEGGILRNARGERFMDRYHEDAELAPRDVVSRAIVSEMVRTRTRNVYLDMTHLSRVFLQKRFPRIYSTCLTYDVDIAEEPVPVSPAAHYFMGGVHTDLEGRTTLNGLFAAGEVACTGVHGANRLASNSLLEGIVFGARAGRTALDYGAPLERPRGGQKMRVTVPGKRSYDLDKVRSELRRLMWDRVGIIRCHRSLSEAEERLRRWERTRPLQTLLRADIELQNLLDVAWLVLESAKRRLNSVGAHYRSDHKEKEKGWKRHIRIRKSGQGLTFS